MRVLKYTMVFILPALFALGVYLGSWWTFGPVLFAFGFIPFLEILFQPNAQNLNAAEKEMRLDDKAYDLLLYSVAPVIYATLLLYLVAITTYSFGTKELVGLTFSLGVILGGMGINVAHELGHRQTAHEQFMAKALLLPSAYMHFFIEHNRGHHKNVSTYEDPASSRLNETLYHFWIRSVVYGYISAWTLEKQRLQRAKKSVWSLKNEMIRFQLIQILFWLAIGLIFGWYAMLLYTGAAIVGFLMLETVNYIEHYGLARKKVSENRYERVEPIHSWNSNHIVGRVMLFELSRHSDHHYKPAKKYQILEHHDHSPQMPTGYPGMMLLSAIPPLWFSVMNPKIDRSNSDRVKTAAV
ncbi:alkane 1-monooxygenase [Cryomorphaceae bacterium 1068]|nr:alkane 1-monooxygenase [Cryomorphaceae bacterium 1068]